MPHCPHWLSSTRKLIPGFSPDTSSTWRRERRKGRRKEGGEGGRERREKEWKEDGREEGREEEKEEGLEANLVHTELKIDHAGVLFILEILYVIGD